MEFSWDDRNFDGNFNGNFEENLDWNWMGIFIMDSMEWHYDSFDCILFILLQPFDTHSNIFKPSYSSLAHHVSVYSSLVQSIPTYSSVFQHIPSYSILFEDILASSRDIPSTLREIFNFVKLWPQQWMDKPFCRGFPSGIA